jgi:hypothetical protein
MPFRFHNWANPLWPPWSVPEVLIESLEDVIIYVGPHHQGGLHLVAPGAARSRSGFGGPAHAHLRAARHRGRQHRRAALPARLERRARACRSDRSAQSSCRPASSPASSASSASPAPIECGPVACCAAVVRVEAPEVLERTGADERADDGIRAARRPAHRQTFLGDVLRFVDFGNESRDCGVGTSQVDANRRRPGR